MEETIHNCCVAPARHNAQHLSSRPYNGGAFESLSIMYSSPCVHACCLPACLPVLLEFAQARPTMSCIALVTHWGEPERAPPRALQRLRSLSHGNDGNNISYVLPNAHARSLRGEFKGQSRQKSRTGETREV